MGPTTQQEEERLTTSCCSLLPLLKLRRIILLLPDNVDHGFGEASDPTLSPLPTSPLSPLRNLRILRPHLPFPALPRRRQLSPPLRRQRRHLRLLPILHQIREHHSLENKRLTTQRTQRPSPSRDLRGLGSQQHRRLGLRRTEIYLLHSRSIQASRLQARRDHQDPFFARSKMAYPLTRPIQRENSFC